MYVLLFFSVIALFLTLLSSRGAKFDGLKLGFFLVTLLAAIHYNYGSDYPEYLSKYKEFISHSYSFIDVLKGDIDDRAGENGWLLLMYLMRPLGISGFYVLVALLSIFQGVVVYQLIQKYVPNKWKVLALFVYLFNTSLYVGSMSGLRQHLAMTIIGCALPFILNKKLLYSLLIVLIATTVHKSAFVFIPFAFWGFISPRRGKLIVIILLAAVVVLFASKEYIEALSEWLFLIEDFQIYQHYAEQEKTVSYGIGFILSLIPVFLSLKILLKANVSDDVYKIVGISAISYVLMPITTTIALAARIGYYFEFFSIIALPYCYSSVKNKGIRIALLALFVLLYVYSYYNYFFLPERYQSTFIYHSLLELI